VNEAIRISQVRVIDEAGNQLGVLDTRDALRMAESRGLDLVEVAPNADPPVCRFIDYGKFIYEKAKKEREARRAQKTVDVKEIRLRPKIGDHDVDFKVRDARRWLAEGDKVKVRVVFRGREITHPEVGKDLLDRIAQALSDVAMVEQKLHAEGHSLLMILSPGSGKSA
jgi:translation initiation factor IF-3